MHNFSARLWEQLVHFHVMRLTDSLFLWVGAAPHLRNLAVAMCSRYVSEGGPGRRGSGCWGHGGRGPRAAGRWDGRAPGSRRGDRGLGCSRPAGVTFWCPELFL